MAAVRRAATQRQIVAMTPLPRRYADPVRTALLWLASAIGGDQLAAAGLSREEQQQLQEGVTAEERREIEWLRVAGNAMTKPVMAKLVRGRLAEFAMATRTPAEMATLARAVRTVPDWVWDGATGLPSTLMQHAAHEVAAADGPRRASYEDTASPNRAERRRLARLER